MIVKSDVSGISYACGGVAVAAGIQSPNDWLSKRTCRMAIVPSVLIATCVPIFQPKLPMMVAVPNMKLGGRFCVVSLNATVWLSWKRFKSPAI